MELPKIAEQFPVLAPLFHLLLCAAFLCGYSAGFGAGIGGLFSVSDLFSLSLTDLIFLYIFGLLFPALFIAPHFQPNFVPLATRLARSNDPSDAQLLKFLRKTINWFLVALAAIWLLFLIPAIGLAIMYDQRIPYSDISGVIPAVVTFFWLKYSSNLTTKFRTDLITAALLSLIAGAMFFGLARGQEERRYSVDNFSTSYLKCGTMTVLRPISSRFLALDRYGRRWVIDESCKPIFHVPDRPAFQKVTPIELLVRWWNS